MKLSSSSLPSDNHPGAKIGGGILLDHATGVVDGGNEEGVVMVAEYIYSSMVGRGKWRWGGGGESVGRREEI
ncbi:hypothetical protein HAX54_045166 [Datura stramonium]|uniref:Uncharacterized protein n=1 Tax=Datura stramonium TaxID=4076 RepID=A0ABS8SQE2_DATST|nr:hypothetical protein [Datura stramonium]